VVYHRYAKRELWKTQAKYEHFGYAMLSKHSKRETGIIFTEDSSDKTDLRLSFRGSLAWFKLEANGSGKMCAIFTYVLLLPSEDADVHLESKDGKYPCK
jgi:hypothetical protein